MTQSRRNRRKRGPEPLVDKRDHYLRLMDQGMSNSAACKIVGVHRRTGTRWRYGRTYTDKAGRSYSYAPITEQPKEISPRFLSEDERVTIADLLRAGRSIRAIAKELERSPATISREVRRNSDPNTGVYHPHRAQQRAVARRARSREGKLQLIPELRDLVQQYLDQRWSPEQISSVLREQFPDRPEMQLAPESIYQAVCHPERTGLERDVVRKLRTGRSCRRRRRLADQRATRFVDPGTLVSQRPAEAEDRAVPGHWEGDLIMGTGNRSAIGTLVERSSRYVILLHLPDGRSAEHVRDALIRHLEPMPKPLARSLTWDQGTEMSRHGEFTLATDVPVYFCDPASPRQLGSNENTNGLLR